MKNKQGKVWGFTEQIFGKNNVSIHRIAVNPGGFCSIHKHIYNWNMFYVESGALDVKTWKNDYDLVDKTTLYESEGIMIKPGEFHQFQNNTDEMAIVYEIYWTELDENDIERNGVGGKQI